MSDSSDVVGFVAPDVADLAPLFPGYEIQSLIATGGMGAVYCAVQKSLDRTVALKILPLELSKDAAFCAGFEAEAKAMARLNHPNLIGVYDFGEVNGMLYIIMEFVAGQSIYHSANGIAIDPSEVIRLVTGVCEGLAHAHSNGIIHRDIKPSNILLDLKAQPKIGDFGLARPIERKVVEGEEIFGTPHYTAPEVVDAPYSVDYRADIFSVGVMLHELLTGKLPANDLRPASLIARCDIRFDAIIKRATQSLPSARYSNAMEIANDLQAIARTVKTTGAKSSVPGVPRSVVARRKYASKSKNQSLNASSIFLILVVGAAATAAYLFFSKSDPLPTNVQTVIIAAPKASEKIKEDAPVDLPEVDSTDLPPAQIVEETSSEVARPRPTPRVEEEVKPEIPLPKSDVAAFLVRARSVMQERTAPMLKTHGSDLKDNVLDLIRDLERALRKNNYYRGSAETYVERQAEEWKEAGNRIPKVLKGWISDIPGTTKAFIAHREKQTEIDTTLRNGLTSESETYILGLTKQIERLKVDKDIGAIALIEKEIESTKESVEYFAKLMGARDIGDEE